MTNSCSTAARRDARRWIAPTLLSLLPLAACSGGGDKQAEAIDSGGIETGTIALTATDAPLDHALVERAQLAFDRIEIHRAGSGDGEWTMLYDGPPRAIELSELRNGVTYELLTEELEVGTYDQLRLHAVGGELELVNTNLYTVAADTLRLGSLGTSGLKLHFDPAIEVAGGLSSDLLLDFDLSKLFKPIPANDPENASRFNLHPSIRVANLSETGEISGFVSEDDGVGGKIGSDTASVYLMEAGDTDLDDAIATTASESNGAYALLGVEPGVYDVIAVREGLDGTLAGVVVVAGNATIADLTIE